ncbi:MAG: LysM peptidoglycan-binding domain-containing protein, partial [Nitrospirota bacterium]
MKKLLLSMMVIFALFLYLAPAFAQGEADQPAAGDAAGQPFEGRTSVSGAPWTGTYTIVKGDTLWDISKARLSDPFAWPRIWKKNQFIHNPNLIYPGQVIKLPPGVTIAPPAAKEVPPPVKKPRSKEPFVSKGYTLMTRPSVSEGGVITIPPPPTRHPVASPEVILEAGFV